MHVPRVSIPYLHMTLLPCMLSCRRCCPSPHSLLHWGRECAAWNYPTCQWVQCPMQLLSTMTRSMSEHRTEMKAINWYSLFLSTPVATEWCSHCSSQQPCHLDRRAGSINKKGHQVLPSTPTRRVSPTAISRDNLLLVTGGVAEGESIFNTTDVLDLTTMKWTTPEGLNLPVPLWQHHLALCGENLYLLGGATVYPVRLTKGYPILQWQNSYCFN